MPTFTWPSLYYSDMRVKVSCVLCDVPADTDSLIVNGHGGAGLLGPEHPGGLGPEDVLVAPLGRVGGVLHVLEEAPRAPEELVPAGELAVAAGQGGRRVLGAAALAGLRAGRAHVHLLPLLDAVREHEAALGLG